MKKRRNPWGGLLRGLFLPVLAVVVLLGFTAALDSLDSGRDTENRRQLEEALRRGCTACYAAEGVYPPTLEYLEVDYRVFAENVMPDITVLVQTS